MTGQLAGPPPSVRSASRRRFVLFGPDRLSGGAAGLVFALLLLVPTVWMLGYLFPPINHDAAANLDVAKRWLDGDRLYAEIIDVNLPLVFMLFAIPEVLSRLTGIGAPTLMVACLIVAIGISSWLSRRILDAMPTPHHALTGALLPVMLLFLLAVFPNDMFGQREHLMMIASAPYVLLSGCRAAGDKLPRALRIGTAISAGIGFALKPHFLVMPFLIEAYVLLNRGWRDGIRDPVPWTMGAVFFGHLAFTVLATPEYFTFLLPLLLEDYADLGQGDSVDVLMGGLIGPTVLTLIPLTVAAFFLSRSRLQQVVALYAIGAVISAAAQAKGWTYQSLPALAATLLLAAVVIAEMIDRYLPLDRVQQRLPVAVLTAAFMLLFFYEAALFEAPFAKQREFDDSITGVLTHVVEQNAENDEILILSPGIYPHYPLINYTGAEMAMKFQTMWLLQGIYADCDEFAPLYNPPEAMNDAEEFIFRSVPEEFARRKPSLLIVDTIAGIPRCQAREFNYLDYFLRNPLFAKNFDEYELLMEVDRYAIYKRE